MSTDRLPEIVSNVQARAGEMVQDIASGKDLVGARIIFALAEQSLTRLSLDEKVREALKYDQIDLDPFTVMQSLAHLEAIGLVNWQLLTEKTPVVLTEQGQTLAESITWRFI